MKILLFILLTMGSMLFAAETPENCLRQAIGHGQTEIVSQACIKHTMNSAQAHLKQFTPNGSHFVYAWENIIVVRAKKDKKYHTNVISGPNTGIEEVLSLKLSDNGKEVFVLNKGKNGINVLVFQTNHAGNIKPRSIEHDSLSNAKDLCLGKNRIYVLLKKQVISFDSKANSRSRRVELVPVAEEVMEENDFLQTDQILVHANILYLLKMDENVISSYDISKKNKLGDKQLVDFKIKAPTAIFINKFTNEIVVKSESGKRAWQFSDI